MRHHAATRSATYDTGEGPPGLDLSVAVFDRATRLARGLFESADASIILAQDGCLWRSRHADVLPPHDPFIEQVLQGGALRWIEDARLDATLRDHPLVCGPPHLCFTVAVPIRLEDGSTPGVLSVSGRRPQPFDAAKAARLEDIADFVADEWRRARAVAALAHSLHERDRALERSAQTESRLQIALALADVHVWEIDYKRRELSKAGAEDTFFAVPQTFESLSRNLFATIDPRDHESVAAAWRDHVENGTPFRPVYRICRPDGAEAWAQASIKFFFDGDGRPLRMVGAVQNITARKQTERALMAAKEEADAANRATSAFLATMSHESRTPLNASLGFSEMITEQIVGPVQDRYVDYANDIHASGQHLLDLVNDVLDISKLEAGKFELHESEFGLGNMLAEVIGSFRGLAEAAGIAIRSESAGLPALRADRRLLKQVLLNLISNALKFTGRGGAITVAAASAPGAELALRVSDTGIGMSPDEMAVALIPFGQVESSIARESKGTGLGLPIAKALMQLHGGDLFLDSAPGRGTSVTITLPAARVLERREASGALR